jgi:uncharacterized membrane protein
MLSVIAAHQAMKLTMLIVLALIGLNIVVGLLMTLRGSADLGDLAGLATRPLLYDVLPLILLSLLTTLDPTKLLVLIWYYLAALLIAIRTVLDLGKALKK